MKTNLLIIFIILILGVGMAGYSYNKLATVDIQENEYILKSLSKLKKLEQNVDVLMLRSRYGLDRDYDNLSKMPNYISAKYEDLREGTSKFGDEKFVKLIADYGKNNEIRAEMIENFKKHNSLYRNAAVYAPEIGNYLLEYADSTSEAKSYSKMIKDINVAVYELVLKSDETSKRLISRTLPLLDDLEEVAKGAAKTKVLEYKLHLNTLLNEKTQTDAYIDRASSLPTENLLDAIETDYASFYNNAMKSNGDTWYYIIGYVATSVLLLLLLSFRIIMTGNKPELDRQTTERFARRINRVSTSIDGVINDVGEVQGLMNTVKHVCTNVRKRDMKKVGELLKSLVVEYETIEKEKVFSDMNLKLYSTKDNVNELQSKLEA